MRWRILVFTSILLVYSCGGTTQKVHQMLSGQLEKDESYLMDAVTEKEYDWVCQDAAIALGTMKSNKAVPVLIAVLNDMAVSPYCRMGAGYALGLIGDQTAATPLIRALEQAKIPEERYWLIAGLAAFTSHDSVRAALEALLNDADILVARGAKKALLGKEVQHAD